MLEALFERARNEQRAAFIPYVMAGDPDLETSELVLHALTQAGADAIEVGIPYGDPLADGPTIAAAGQRALHRGVTVHDTLALVERFRQKRGAPVVLFTYFNPVYQYGIERFARDAASAAACGVIVPDIALEESENLERTFAENGLDMPLLIAPTTRRERAQRIVARASGFIYVVSRLGVTGAGQAPDVAPLREQVAMLRGLTEEPLVAGFGISTAAHVCAVTSFVDGVIVGSAIIDAYAGYAGEEAAQRVRTFVEPIVNATRKTAAPF